jgi:hypothetical protein
MQGSAGARIADKTYKAAGFFARFADALDQGDLAAAAKAQAGLAGLGFSVVVGARAQRRSASGAARTAGPALTLKVCDPTPEAAGGEVSP